MMKPVTGLIEFVDLSARVIHVLTLLYALAETTNQSASVHLEQQAMHTLNASVCSWFYYWLKNYVS
jgi:hypothetical protein